MNKDLKMKLKQLERENKILKEEIESLFKDFLFGTYNRNFLIKLQQYKNWFYNVH